MSDGGALEGRNSAMDYLPINGEKQDSYSLNTIEMYTEKNPSMWATIHQYKLNRTLLHLHIRLVHGSQFLVQMESLFCR